MIKVKKTSKKFSGKAKENYLDTVKYMIEALKEMTDCMEKSVSILENVDKRLKAVEVKYANERRS